jgi:hypothetical protein
VDHTEPAVSPKLPLKVVDQHLIHFDCDHTRGKLEQVLREGAAARTDFNDGEVRVLNRGAGNPLKHGRPGKEVLAETAGHPAPISL